jgi:hypothetical protein
MTFGERIPLSRKRTAAKVARAVKPIPIPVRAEPGVAVNNPARHSAGQALPVDAGPPTGGTEAP